VNRTRIGGRGTERAWSAIVTIAAASNPPGLFEPDSSLGYAGARFREKLRRIGECLGTHSFSTDQRSSARFDPTCFRDVSAMVGARPIKHISVKAGLQGRETRRSLHEQRRPAGVPLTGLPRRNATKLRSRLYCGASATRCEPASCSRIAGYPCRRVRDHNRNP